MTLERSRRLINGVWQYVTAPDGGGSGGLPSGGSTGEVLTKLSNADGDAGWGAGGGSQSVKHVIVPIVYTDIDAATGLADLYLLPENETIVGSWPVVTEGFNGTDSGTGTFMSAGAYGPSGAAGASQISDSYSLTQPNLSADGLIGPDPGDNGGSSTTTTMFPIAAPVPGGGAVQTVIDFAAGNVPLTTIGTAGALDYHLLIAVAP